MKTNDDSRPVDLNIWQVKLPITALVSIMHRLSGLLLFLSLPFLLWCLNQSLQSPQQFNAINHVLNISWVKVFIWFLLSSFFYHLGGGIRHIVLEMGIIGESRYVGRITAFTVILFSVIFALVLGVRLF